MSADYPLVARSGWPLLLAVILLALLLGMGLGLAWAVPLLLLAVSLAFLFRDPDRAISSAPLGVVSPVDGRVSVAERCHDPYLDREAIRISLCMSLLGPYSVRSPAEGKIRQIWYHPASEPSPGKALSDREGGQKRRYAIWVQTDEQDDVVLTLDVQRSFFRPRCYVHIGQRVGQGQRCGIMGFGGDVSVYVPGNSRLQSQSGDQVMAGSDVIASLVHE